jgi:hypothetical protein
LHYTKLGSDCSTFFIERTLKAVANRLRAKQIAHYPQQLNIPITRPPEYPAMRLVMQRSPPTVANPYHKRSTWRYLSRSLPLLLYFIILFF